jgi:hypothetical protein
MCVPIFAVHWNPITASLCNILAKPLSREFITLNILYISNKIGQMIYNPKFLRKICIFAKGYPLRRWLLRHANHSQWSWIQILDASWQVTNQNASKQSAWVTMASMKQWTITWTAGGVFLIWQQPISACDLRSALILTGCRDVRLCSVDTGRMGRSLLIEGTLKQRAHAQNFQENV